MKKVFLSRYDEMVYLCKYIYIHINIKLKLILQDGKVMRVHCQHVITRTLYSRKTLRLIVIRSEVKITLSNLTLANIINRTHESKLTNRPTVRQSH